MTDGQIVVSISSHDLDRMGNAAGKAAAEELRKALYNLKEAIDALTKKQGEIKSELETLKEMEISKAEAKISVIEKIQDGIIRLYNEAKQLFEREEDEIKTKYDRTIRNKVHKFLETISINTDILETLKEELREIDTLKQSMFESIDKLKSVHEFNYRVRQARLKSGREKILKNIDDFLGKREDTVNKILNLQTALPKQVTSTKETSIFYMPFWVVGLTDGGKEEIQVFPIQRIMPPDRSPTRECPYIEHNIHHEAYGVEEKLPEVTKYFSQPENVKKAKENSILNEKDKIMENIGRLYNVGCIDRTNRDGSSTFVDALNMFVGGIGKQTETLMASALPGTSNEVARTPLTRIRCKKCGEIIDVFSAERPLEIICPKCGVKGTLK